MFYKNNSKITTSQQGLRRKSVPLTTLQPQQNFYLSCSQEALTNQSIQQQFIETTTSFFVEEPLVPPALNERLSGAKFKCKRVKAAKQLSELLFSSFVVNNNNTEQLHLKEQITNNKKLSTSSHKAQLFSSIFKEKGISLLAFCEILIFKSFLKIF